MPNKNIIFVQPSVPVYRTDFFERCYLRCNRKVSVYAGVTDSSILSSDSYYNWLFSVGKVRALMGFEWQTGVISIPIARNDILVLPSNPRFLSNIILAIKAWSVGAKIVLWGHYWSSTSKPWRQRIRRVLMRFANGLIFYTERELVEFSSTCFFDYDSIPMVGLNNGINFSPIRLLREDYYAQNRSDALLFVGRLTEKSMLGLAFAAMARLGDSSPSLHVIGDGPMGLFFHNESIVHGIERKVIWHGQLIEENQIASIANSCKAFLYPGEVGLSLIHGLAYGLPAIVHDLPGKHMPEFAAFKPGFNGWSFDYGDAESLASTIKSALSNPDVLDDFSKNATLTIGPDFTTEGMANKFACLVQLMSIGT